MFGVHRFEKNLGKDPVLKIAPIFNKWKSVLKVRAEYIAGGSRTLF